MNARLYMIYRNVNFSVVDVMNRIFSIMRTIIENDTEGKYVGVPIYQDYYDFCLKNNYLDVDGKPSLDEWKSHVAMMIENEYGRAK